MTQVVVTTTQAIVEIVDNGAATTVLTTPAPATVEISAPGPAGPPGPGVPVGGTTYQLLAKASNTNFDTEWTSTPQVDKLAFDLAAAATAETGQLAWNADELTLDLGKGGGTTLQIGQEQLTLCRNGTGSTIPKGAGVMFAGTVGNSGRLVVAPMVANGTYPGYVFFGVTTAAITSGADGFVTTFGKIRGIDTTAYSEGDILWCSPATPGGFTTTEPQAPNLKLAVAAVVSAANNGTIFVRSTAGSKLKDLHDVEANGSTSDGDVLAWNQTAGRWEPADANELAGGLPTGGVVGNILLKDSSANYDASWVATLDGGTFN